MRDWSPSHCVGRYTTGISGAGEAWPQPDPGGSLGIEAAARSYVRKLS